MRSTTPRRLAQCRSVRDGVNRSTEASAWQRQRIDRRARRLRAVLHFIDPNGPESGRHVRAFADPWVHGTAKAQAMARRRAARFVAALAVALTPPDRTAVDRSGPRSTSPVPGVGR